MTFLSTGAHDASIAKEAISSNQSSSGASPGPDSNQLAYPTTVQSELGRLFSMYEIASLCCGSTPRNDRHFA
jgi:hypothetical protein